MKNSSFFSHRRPREKLTEGENGGIKIYSQTCYRIGMKHFSNQNTHKIIFAK